MANQDRHSYVQFYSSDWLAGMAFMPPMVEWLYLQICLYNWDKREPLPAVEARLRLSRSPQWEDDLAMLLEAGKVIRTQAGGLFVERAMVEAERAYDLWERKSRGGRVSQNKRDNQGQAQQSLNTLAGSLASNESESESENERGDKSPHPPTPLAGDLVFSVPAEVMKQFRDHRRAIKAPLSKGAEALLLRKLEQIHAEHGHDPTAVLEQSILNGWRGVFELKGDGNGKRNSNSRNGLLDAALDELGQRGRPHR